MKRFYVTMTWEQWPEGGSYGTTVDAEDWADAERRCRREMAAHRADPDDPGMDECYYLENYGDDWHIVDCFDLDEFIAQHSKKEDSDVR